MIKEILQGRFMRHPLHPMLVHLPIGLWVASFFFDIFYFLTGEPSLAAVSYFTIAGGLIGALLAIGPGIAEYISIPSNTRPKQIATTHMILNVIVTFIFLGDFLLRYRYEGRIPTLVPVTLFIVSLIGVIGLSISGYLGGLLVYEHAIGYRPDIRDQEDDQGFEKKAA